MEVEELWASWDGDLGISVCFWCEDRPATGRLILVRKAHGKPIRSGPVICNFCNFDADGIETDLPDGSRGRWVYVEFKG